ncbi:MAG: L,D-transpeptidase [Bacteroidetes bacterium]|nr:L,D-transpeptidase [Bacteroidota bacterium]
MSFAFSAGRGTEEPALPKNDGFYEYNRYSKGGSASKINILSEADVSVGLKDTVYTDKDCWLELRIDQQMLYQHWKNGRVDKYPISSGNKYLDRSIESRPGLFAIFHKEEHHESSQYNNADMYYFMPFNQGIGFHSLDGTGYYGNLGVRPSSHGCIRMRHDDVKKLFRECPIGTLVLAHRGASARVVGFAPDDYASADTLTKDEAKLILAENLLNILDGNYFVTERKFIVVDPKVIPVSGVYIAYDRKLPDRQRIVKSLGIFLGFPDVFFNIKTGEMLDSTKSAEYTADLEVNEEDIKGNPDDSGLSTAEIVKKYFNNPIGVLPYFPPKDK